MMRLLKNILVAAAGFFAGKLTSEARQRGRRRQQAEALTEGEVHVPREWATLRETIIPSNKAEAKRFCLRLAALVPVIAIGGFLLAASGIIPIKASSGHFAVTRWFLNFSMSRSVSLHSIGIDAPGLDDSLLVLKGAGHYEVGCRPCHGGPKLERPRIPGAMTPEPPHLTEKINLWQPEELFYIVKHGVKFTGMPAWPAQSRDDEVWAVVAFLLRLPDLSVAEYESLVDGNSARMEGPVRGTDSPTADTAAAVSTPVEGLVQPEGMRPTTDIPRAVSDRCGRCHGVEGGGRGIGSFPRLAGQSPHYTFASLLAYKLGERHSGMMQPIAAGLSDEEMREIAFYYSRLSAPPVSSARGAEGSIQRGERIAHDGIPEERVPSCADCHGPSPLPKNPFYPYLAGQYAEYIALQLELFKGDRRGGSVYARLMHPTADDLTEDEMHDVAVYYASLEP